MWLGCARSKYYHHQQVISCGFMWIHCRVDSAGVLKTVAECSVVFLYTCVLTEGNDMSRLPLEMAVKRKNIYIYII